MSLNRNFQFIHFSVTTVTFLFKFAVSILFSFFSLFLSIHSFCYFSSVCLKMNHPFLPSLSGHLEIGARVLDSSMTGADLELLPGWRSDPGTL